MRFVACISAKLKHWRWFVDAGIRTDMRSSLATSFTGTYFKSPRSNLRHYDDDGPSVFQNAIGIELYGLQ
jgi:hypothetical protein